MLLVVIYGSDRSIDGNYPQVALTTLSMNEDDAMDGVGKTATTHA